MRELRKEIQRFGRMRRASKGTTTATTRTSKVLLAASTRRVKGGRSC
jgi:hypothetical protein